MLDHDAEARVDSNQAAVQHLMMVGKPSVSKKDGGKVLVVETSRRSADAVSSLLSSSSSRTRVPGLG